MKTCNYINDAFDNGELVNELNYNLYGNPRNYHKLLPPYLDTNLIGGEYVLNLIMNDVKEGVRKRKIIYNIVNDYYVELDDIQVERQCKLIKQINSIEFY